MTAVDLHCHSTFSDGALPPAAVVRRAAANGTRLLALTDHDETGGLAQAQAAARECGVRFVNGVEISVSWRGHTVHIVGLGIDPANTELAAGLAAVRAGRALRAERMAQALAELGIEGALEGARRHAANPDMIGRTHFARHLVERGAVKDLQSAFKRYLGAGKPGYVSHQWANLGDAVRWIKLAGGIAAVAHPGRYPLDSRELVGLIGEFRDCGGDAIEVISASHTPHQIGILVAHVRRYGMRASAGSDFHAVGESRFDIGILPQLPELCPPVWEEW